MGVVWKLITKRKDLFLCFGFFSQSSEPPWKSCQAQRRFSERVPTLAGQIVQLIIQTGDPPLKETWERISMMKANLRVLMALCWAFQSPLLCDFVA